MKVWKKRLLLMTAGLLWLGLAGMGMKIVWSHETTPGTAAEPPRLWPSESHIQRAPGRATLVVMAHPRCPCSRASIAELAVIMAQCRGLVDSRVLFYQPPGLPDQWTQTDIWQSAAAIPGVTVERDAGGIEASRFHASTSGQVLLYDAAGRLLFSGGITGSRGHAGDNAGRSAIISLLTATTAEHDRTEVFGCQLFDPGYPKQDGGVRSCSR